MRQQCLGTMSHLYVLPIVWRKESSHREKRAEPLGDAKNPAQIGGVVFVSNDSSHLEQTSARLLGGGKRICRHASFVHSAQYKLGRICHHLNTEYLTRNRYSHCGAMVIFCSTVLVFLTLFTCSFQNRAILPLLGSTPLLDNLSLIHNEEEWKKRNVNLRVRNNLEFVSILVSNLLCNGLECCA